MSSKSYDNKILFTLLFRLPEDHLQLLHQESSISMRLGRGEYVWLHIRKVTFVLYNARTIYT